MEELLTIPAVAQAITATSIAAAATSILAASMFTAYAARLLRKWKVEDQ